MRTISIYSGAQNPIIVFGYMDKSKGYLFFSADLGQVLENQKRALHDELERLEANRLLNTASADLAKYFVDKYKVEALKLRRDEWTVDAQETRIDVSRDPLRYIHDASQPFYIPGQRFEVEVPFDGEPELFYARPNQFTTNPPRATVRGNVLIIAHQVTHDSQGNIRPAIDRTLNDIEQYVGWVNAQVNSYNNDLPAAAAQAIEQRRRHLLANQSRTTSLGIPIKARADAPKTYAAPSVRKKIIPTLPAASSVPYDPEPVLELGLYDHILTIVQNMTQVMERSPSTFKSMGEEDLRQHFLVQLNGQFEGAASGETFNVSGKTDILLREKGRNIFIAECKFWKGPKVYRGTIDQLLSYTSWRDTKTAIIIFTKGTTLSTVLAGVKSETESHPNYKRTEPWKHESGARFVLHQPGDANRELLLTVLVFDVPA